MFTRSSNRLFIALITALITFQGLAQDSAVLKEHEFLAGFEGKWKAELSAYTQPGAEPIKSEGSAVMKMTLGRFLKTNFTGTFMGQAMEGVGYQGYDKERAVFTSVWMDNTSGNMTISEGTYNEETKELRTEGKMMVPGMGEVPYHTTTKILSENEFHWEMVLTVGEQKMTAMSAVYKRG